MNQGIFGFPTALSNTIISTTEIDVSGTYLIAPGTKRLVIFAVGGGGGGGAGGKRASGATQSGGAGASGGAQIYQDFNVEDLGGVNSTLSIVIGAGGVAGATGLSPPLDAGQLCRRLGRWLPRAVFAPRRRSVCLCGGHGRGARGTPAQHHRGASAPRLGPRAPTVATPVHLGSPGGGGTQLVGGAPQQHRRARHLHPLGL